MTATTLIQVACAPLSAPLRPLQLRPSTRGPSISHYEAATGAPGLAARLRQMADGAQVPAGPVSATVSPQPCCWSRVSPLLCGQASGVCVLVPIRSKKESARRMQGSTPYHAYACLLCIAGRLRIAGRLSPRPLLTPMKPSDDWNQRGRGFSILSLCISIQGPLPGECTQYQCFNSQLSFV